MYTLSHERVLMAVIFTHHFLVAAVIFRKKRAIVEFNSEFNADHPFAYFIQTDTNVVVFEGRFSWADAPISQQHIEL